MLIDVRVQDHLDSARKVMLLQHRSRSEHDEQYVDDGLKVRIEP